MIPVTTMRGRDVALFGLGGSGMATARALVAGGAAVTAWDDNPDSVQRARADGIGTGDLRDADWSRFAALVLAPGVPLTHPKPHWTVELARGAGIEVIGDVELFCRERAATCPDAPFVAITGTNGKSTTTALISHLLREGGRDVQMGGNIGTPILALEPPARTRVHVIECSSYQIDLAPGLAPSVGVLLNITPDHLDRHGTFEHYAAIKERLVAASDVAVVGIDDETTAAVAARRGRRHTHSISGHDRSSLVHNAGQRERSTMQIVHVRDGCIERPFNFGARDARLRIASLEGIAALRGRHNAQNAAAASVAAMVVMHTMVEPGDYDREALQRGLRSFPGLAHRMEPLPESHGVRFYNDSKATNADATAPALSSFERVHWIAGGLPKQGGIEPLRPLFGHVARAYLIGEAAPQFAATLGDTVPYEIAGTLDVAVKRAAHDARVAAANGGGAVVLFSPAAASFDQFRNFEERGEAFRAAVRALED